MSSKLLISWKKILFFVGLAFLLCGLNAKTGEIGWVKAPLYLASFLIVWHSVVLCIIGALILSFTVSTKLSYRLLISTIIILLSSIYLWSSEASIFRKIVKIFPPPTSIEAVSFQKLHGEPWGHPQSNRVEYQTPLAINDLLKIYRSSGQQYPTFSEGYKDSESGGDYIPYWFKEGLQGKFYEIDYLTRYGPGNLTLYLTDYSTHRSVFIRVESKAKGL